MHTVSQRENYWLLNEYDELLKNSYPITKFKVAEKSEEEVYVMEVIRDMRIVNLKREFLVKWLDYPEDDKTWISEEQFTDIDLIEEYFASKSDFRKVDFRKVICYLFRSKIFLKIDFLG